MGTDRCSYADIDVALTVCGLQLRGGFHPAAADDSLLSSAEPTAGSIQTVLLVGNVGNAMWRQFITTAEYRDAKPDPLDRWTRRVLNEIAAALPAAVVFPFGGPPHYPFHRWALRADTVFPSPIGILIHPQFGLWHAYRGALLLPRRLLLPPRQNTFSPCLTCEHKPCMQRCPVDAFSDAGYNATACRSYLRQPFGEDCIKHACAARRACPIGRQYHQLSPQATLHMRTFLDAG